MDGFSSFEGNAKRWIVTHNYGTTYVYALTESIALARFMAQFPNYVVKNIQQG